MSSGSVLTEKLIGVAAAAAAAALTDLFIFCYLASVLLSSNVRGMFLT